MNSDDAAKIKIGGIEFPVALLDALRERRLVVFAGAGVSRGKPACLPDFKGLAREVAKGTGEALKDGDNPSLFLDKLADAGVKVHERAAESLRRGLMPTETHKNLLLLFQKYDPVRIVTTNFDLLFEKAIDTENLFNSEVESYRAPALPLGSDFDGIVHVHGSVKRANDMVLTDTDFGKAYLTDGSARRFLRGAFANYTILFVGYSHNDTILNYLARALPPTDQKRFALIPKKSKAAHWDRLKIERIEYPISGNDHQALHTGIHALKEFVNRRPTEWRNKIERIVNKSPGDLGDDQNLLEYALKEKTHVGSFTNAAESCEWLDWVDDQRYLNEIFDERSHDERIGLWAHWLVEKFAVAHADSLQRVIGRREGRLPAYFWKRLSYVVQSTDLDENALRKWVSLLLSRAPQQMAISSDLSSLGQRCAESGLMFEAAQIFNLMLAIQPFIERYDFSTIGPEYEHHDRLNIREIYNPVYAAQLWKNALLPNIDLFAGLLIDKLIERLEERHFTLNGWGSTDRHRDWSLTHISPIKDISNHLGVRGYERTVIRAARDCLDWMIEKRRKEGLYWQNRLANSEAPLLRALASHSVRMDVGLLPDKKAVWLLETNSLLEVKRINDRAPYKELYALAKQIYPRLNDERRRAMIEAIEEYRFLGQNRERNEKLKERHRYDWYHILHCSDPECPLAGQAFEEAQRKHPEWKPSPDIGGIQIRYGLSTPLTADELLEKPGSEWVSELVYRFIEESKRRHEDNWCSGLADAVMNASKEKFKWSLELADALAEAGEWDIDAWYGLIRGWYRNEGISGTDLNKKRYRKALERIRHDHLYGKAKIAHAIVETLQALVINGGTEYASELLPEANIIASALWKKTDKSNASALVRYWLDGLWINFKESGSEPSGLEEEWIHAFKKVLDDPTQKGRNGKIALAREFATLLYLDEAWTTEKLLPLFYSKDDAEFEAVWSGLLWPRMRINKQSATALLDPTFKAVPRILPNSDLRNSFTDHYVHMINAIVEDPQEKWIPEFFKHSSEENRREFTHSLDSFISLSYLHKKENELRGMWNRWIKRYWKDRLQGVPKPLDSQEIYKMYAWPVYFGAHMPEAVELAIKMEPTDPNESFGTDIFFELQKPEIWSNYPKATAKLLLHLSALSHGPGALGDLHSWGPEIIDNLLTCDLPEKLKSDLEDLRATLS